MFCHMSLLSTCLMDKYSSQNASCIFLYFIKKKNRMPPTPTSQNTDKSRISVHFPRSTYTLIHSLINLSRHPEYLRCRNTIVDSKMEVWRHQIKSYQNVSKPLYHHDLNSLLFIHTQFGKHCFPI